MKPQQQKIKQNGSKSSQYGFFQGQLVLSDGFTFAASVHTVIEFIDSKFPGVLHGTVPSGMMNLNFAVTEEDVRSCNNVVKWLCSTYPREVDTNNKEGDELEEMSFFAFGELNRAGRTSMDWLNGLLQALYITCKKSQLSSNDEKEQQSAISPKTTQEVKRLIPETPLFPMQENQGLRMLYRGVASVTATTFKDPGRIVETLSKIWLRINERVQNSVLNISNLMESATGVQGLTSSKLLDKNNVRMELRRSGLINEVGIAFVTGVELELDLFYKKGICNNDTISIWGDRKGADEDLFTFVERFQEGPLYVLEKNSPYSSSKLLTGGVSNNSRRLTLQESLYGARHVLDCLCALEKGMKKAGWLTGPKAKVEALVLTAEGQFGDLDLLFTNMSKNLRVMSDVVRSQNHLVGIPSQVKHLTAMARREGFSAGASTAGQLSPKRSKSAAVYQQEEQQRGSFRKNATIVDLSPDSSPARLRLALPAAPASAAAASALPASSAPAPPVAPAPLPPASAAASALPAFAAGASAPPPVASAPAPAALLLLAASSTTTPPAAAVPVPAATADPLGALVVVATKKDWRPAGPPAAVTDGDIVTLEVLAKGDLKNAVQVKRTTVAVCNRFDINFRPDLSKNVLERMSAKCSVLLSELSIELNDPKAYANRRKQVFRLFNGMVRYLLKHEELLTTFSAQDQKLLRWRVDGDDDYKPSNDTDLWPQDERKRPREEEAETTTSTAAVTAANKKRKVSSSLSEKEDTTTTTTVVVVVAKAADESLVSAAFKAIPADRLAAVLSQADNKVFARKVVMQAKSGVYINCLAKMKKEGIK